MTDTTTFEPPHLSRAERLLRRGSIRRVGSAADPDTSGLLTAARGFSAQLDAIRDSDRSPHEKREASRLVLAQFQKQTTDWTAKAADRYQRAKRDAEALRDRIHGFEQGVTGLRLRRAEARAARLEAEHEPRALSQLVDAAQRRGDVEELLALSLTSVAGRRAETAIAKILGRELYDAVASSASSATAFAATAAATAEAAKGLVARFADSQAAACDADGASAFDRVFSGRGGDPVDVDGFRPPSLPRAVSELFDVVEPELELERAPGVPQQGAAAAPSGAA